MLEERRFGASQLSCVLFLALIQAANLIELPEARQRCRCVIGKSFQGAQIKSSGIDRRMRSYLEACPKLQYSPAEERPGREFPTTPPRPDRGAADRGGNRERRSCAARAHNDGKDVIPVQGPYGQLDDAGHGSQGTCAPNQRRHRVGQRDHRQVVSPTESRIAAAESYVLSILSGSSREVEMRKNASSRSRTASSSRVLSEIRRSSVP